MFIRGKLVGMKGKLFVSYNWLSEQYPSWFDQHGNLKLHKVPVMRVVFAIQKQKVNPDLVHCEVHAEKRTGVKQSQLDKDYDAKMKEIVKKNPDFAWNWNIHELALPKATNKSRMFNVVTNDLAREVFL